MKFSRKYLVQGLMSSKCKVLPVIFGGTGSDAEVKFETVIQISRVPNTNFNGLFSWQLDFFGGFCCIFFFLSVLLRHKAKLWLS